MSYFSIKDLETFSGIKAHTIRTWEQRFSFLQPKRSDKLRRTYSIDELKLFLDVAFLNHNGYKVSHIAKLNKEELGVLVSSLSNVRQMQGKAIMRLITCMATMELHNFEMMLESCVLAWGIDVTITEIIIPFSQKTSLLQSSSPRELKPNLLLIEQTIKQKMITGIEKADPEKVDQCVLFILSKKSNELDFLQLQYQLKISGFCIVYISSPVTQSQLNTIAAAIKPSFIITSLADKNNQFDTPSFLSYLRKHLPETVFLNLSNSVPLPLYAEEQKARQSDSVSELLQWIKEKDRIG